jgi:hypothetical protein
MSRQSALYALGLSVFDLVVLRQQFVEQLHLSNLRLVQSFKGAR